MAYSETRLVIGGLAYFSVLIFMANFIKGKFGIKTEEFTNNLVKEDPVKVFEVKVKKEDAIKDLSIKLDNI